MTNLFKLGIIQLDIISLIIILRIFSQDVIMQFSPYRFIKIKVYNEIENCFVKTQFVARLENQSPLFYEYTLLLAKFLFSNNYLSLRPVMICELFYTDLYIFHLFLQTSFYLYTCMTHNKRIKNLKKSRPPQTRYSPKLFLKTYIKVEIVAWQGFRSLPVTGSARKTVRTAR